VKWLVEMSAQIPSFMSLTSITNKNDRNFKRLHAKKVLGARGVWWSDAEVHPQLLGWITLRMFGTHFAKLNNQDRDLA
jgi:hypothetical protein